MSVIPPAKWAIAAHHQRILETKECLAGLADRNACAGKIVRAHIVPRSQLRQIAARGQVHAVPTRLTDVMQMQHFTFGTKDIGVGQFSVLDCFCARHDKTLFAPLEDRPLTFSPEQIVLLHYRAIAAEAYRRRNQEDSAAAICRTYRSDDPRRDKFFWLWHSSSRAAEQAEDSLDRIEQVLIQKRYDEIRALLVRFKAEPSLLSVGAFRPLYDVTGKRVQDGLIFDGQYVAMHILGAHDRAVLVFTWLRRQKKAERFVRTFAAQPPEQFTTLAVQTAFEYAEHTCMRRQWWLQLNERQRRSLLKRVQNANSLNYQRTRKYLSFRSSYDDWKLDRFNFVHC
jgi:hypothetical protein